MKPNPELRSILAHEDVLTFSDKEIKNMEVDKLDTLIDYYSTTLEVLAGKQVWDILDTLKSAKIEIYNRNHNSFRKAM
jgi:hypothetical protein